MCQKFFWNLMYRVRDIMYQDFQFLTHKAVNLWMGVAIV